ncbi:UNVERIFIED_CONTAM: hypothetical protein Sindi_1830300 [Sesamum indicum]
MSMQTPTGDLGDGEDGQADEGAVGESGGCRQRDGGGGNSAKNQISRKEDEGTEFSNVAILVGVSMGNGREGSMEDSGNVSVLEKRRLSVVTGSKMAPPFLGFLEPETSLPEKSSESDVFQGIVRGTVNGGRDSSLPVTEFNFEEFLKLANRVVDGDEASMAALKKLQKRWKDKYGKGDSKMEAAAAKLRPLLRCSVPVSLTRNQTGEIHLPPENRTAVPGFAKKTTDRVSGDCAAWKANATMDKRAEEKAVVFPASSPANGLDEAGDDVSMDAGDVAHCGGDVDDYMEDDMYDDVTDDAVNDDVIADYVEITNDITTDVTPDITADVNADITLGQKVEKTSLLIQQPVAIPTELFVGNIPLHAYSSRTVDDKIAQAFNNSTRKTLSYIAPTVQNGKVIVRPTLKIVRDGSKRWKSTAVGYFLGKRPYYYNLKEYAHSVWPALHEVTATVNGFYFFQFKTVIDMEEVIEGGPWLFQGQPIVLQKWEPDAITRACTRLDFARVCVMIDVTHELKKHIIIMTPDEEGGETPRKVDIEYEWLPPKCTGCITLGHTTKDCSLNKTQKQLKPPVTIYVPKVNVTTTTAPEKRHGARNSKRMNAVVQEQGADTEHAEHNIPKHSDKAMWNVRGLNKRDHQLALKDLVSEYRLHFLGILETRVCLNNVMHIQSSLLPQWKWFVDYTYVGNRIWLAWDENVVDVHILDLGDQFIHYRVTNMVVNEPVIITVVYGAFEVIDRRNLWITLGTLAQQCSDVPWMVGGDFNAVRDLNEVCGISGDIRMATEEFNAGILEAGLLPLPCKNIWHHEIVGVPMFAVTRKLKALKPIFRLQRRNKGDLTLNVQLANDFLDEAQQLVSSDRQNELYLLLEHCCRIVYAKAAKLEQIMLQQRAKMQWIKEGDQCSRVFFLKIAQRRVMRRILQINDENGNTHTDLGEVAHEFVSYYQNLLGVFDIADDKAPGPDGYSSGFFKAAWPVVGEEVTRAVLEFFTIGKLLKQINSTILALIPKVHTPMSVNDFRPILCCNVLYKIIAKLLVQKISVLLDKIVSPCQTAFIPGRSIGDNIMLAQELFSRYNQMRLPPRCALKVDIRKAYDTVEWDFLLAVLQLFGFPPTFTRWIEECVSITSFSIGLNGKPHGFFSGARGLR